MKQPYLFLSMAGLVACSSSNGSSNAAGASSSGDGGRTQAGVASTPTAQVSCTDVCTNVAKCGVAQATCTSICPKLSLACQGCLAKATCQDACVAADCGNIATSPKKAPQPVPGATCDPLTFDFANQSPSADANAAGGACTVPTDCRSQACVSGKIGSSLVSFCASETDCRETDSQLSDACPSGWKCGEIPSANSGGVTRWTCLPPDANACADGQLSR